MSAFSELAYAPALELASGADVRAAYGLFVAGNWESAATGATSSVTNPATAENLATVALAGPADVERAVRSARRGYDKHWRKMRPSERAKYLYRIARILGERSRAFAVAQTLESGVPIRIASERGIPPAAEAFFYHAGWADKLEWAVGPTERARALGVAAIVLPQPDALLAAARRIAPALAAGNTVVVKPSPLSPLTAADLPPGVVNVVTGDVATGAALVEHPDVDAVAFAGSADVARELRRATAGLAKRLDLTLGGKTTTLVFDDAPLDAAIEGIVRTMLAGGRLLLAENVADEVLAALEARLRTLRHGDPLDRNTDVGALRSAGARERVEAFVRGGIEAGVTLVSAPWTPPDRGAWYPASFFRDAQPTHDVMRAEVPGPVLAVATFRTAAEAIERANDLAFRGETSLWTGGGALALAVASRLRANAVPCNASARADSGGPAALRTFLAL